MTPPSAQRRLAKLMLLAFFVYGGWAGCANAGHGAHVAARSFVVQGISSATTTLLMGAVIEGLRARVGKGFFRELACIAPLSTKNWIFMGLKAARAGWGRRGRHSRAPHREHEQPLESVSAPAGG